MRFSYLRVNDRYSPLVRYLNVPCESTPFRKLVLRRGSDEQINEVFARVLTLLQNLRRLGVRASQSQLVGMQSNLKAEFQTLYELDSSRAWQLSRDGGILQKYWNELVESMLLYLTKEDGPVTLPLPTPHP